MRNLIPFTALGALLAGASAANAQTLDTVIVPQPGPVLIAQAPIATAPAETVETVRTVQSTTSPRHRTAGHHASAQTTRRVTTTRSVVRQGVVAAPVVAAAPALAPAPGYYDPRFYDVYNGGPRYYDVVPAAPPAYVPQPAVDPAVPVEAAVDAPAAPVPVYRYVYEPDRILVIDPYTNIAVQALPR
jgi:hypothetical protein